METQRRTHTEGREPREGRGGYWSDADTMQKMPMIVSGHQELGRRKEEFFSRTFRKSMALTTP